MGYKGYKKDTYGNIVVDNGEMSDSFGVGLGMCGMTFICLALGILCFIGYYYICGFQCRANADKMGFECDYSIITGCKIKMDDGHYIDIDKYRGGFDR